MLYFVFATGECNLRCKYCGGSFPRDKVPWVIKYSIDELRKFIEEDNSATIAFYGGEPLLNIPFIKKVLDEIEAKHFVIQTNGLLVHKLEPNYWKRIDSVLLSIDGREEVTDYYRGKGVYGGVVKAVNYLRKIGFEGDIIARMTVSEKSNLYLEVTHLLSLNLFNHVHWQLDAVWSDRWLNFSSWIEKNYKPGITKLVKIWMNELRKGKVLGIVPFLGITKSFLLKKYASPPCEAGRSAFAILTNRKILACPIAVDAKWAEVGELGKTSSSNLKDSILIGEPCVSCSFFNYCGGRCLYAYKERYWGDKGFKEICEITKHLISKVLENKEEIKTLLREGVINKEEILYPPFNNTTEIIP